VSTLLTCLSGICSPLVGCLGLAVFDCLYCFCRIQYSIDLEYCFAFLFCIYVRVLDLISSLYDLILTRPYLAPTTR
jgi:hypothetical protein